MAIKLPDPGNGIPEQKTGYNEWENLMIVRENFADQSNAASKLVGAETGKIPLFEDASKAFSSTLSANSPTGNGEDFNRLKGGTHAYIGRSAANSPTWATTTTYTRTDFSRGNAGGILIQHSFDRLTGERSFRAFDGVSWSGWLREWHSGNATKDGNGFLKAASPVVDLYDDHIELNNDAVTQGIEFIKNGTGDYTLKTKTGLRSDNTWRIEIPNDDNRNPLFAVDIDAQEDGAINIKCYKRIFSMETFLFGPDFNEPMDIAEGRFISVRLNDNPEPEQLDEPAI